VLEQLAPVRFNVLREQNRRVAADDSLKYAFSLDQWLGPEILAIVR